MYIILRPRFVVSLVWYDASEANGIHHQLGGIHGKDIIVTNWAPDLFPGRESRVYCVLGFNLEEKTLGDRVISWRTTVNAYRIPVIMTKRPEAKEIYKIALVKLEKPVQLDVEIGGYNFRKLPDVPRLTPFGYRFPDYCFSVVSSTINASQL
uniref:Uncharacterized protein n=1 Tax=Glossina pallidipes TaxID=7398 RepID=A0A1A9ZCF0_GLOPL